MDGLLQDLRFAIRGLAHSRGFSAAALFTLAIGIGANATVFSFVNQLILRPAPGVREPQSLCSVFTSDFSSGPYGATSYPDFLSLKEDAAAFTGIATFTETSATLQHRNTSERVRAMTVSGDFFPLLGVRPAHGRLLTASDFSAQAAVAVISHDVWSRSFGGDPGLIGRAITVNGDPTTIVGVASPEFKGLNLGAAIDVWIPLSTQNASAASRGSRGLSIVARLRPGHSVASAQSQLDTIAARLAHAFPDTNMGILGRPDQPRSIAVVRHSRIHPALRGNVVMVGAILMTAVGLVLLAACANVAGLLLSRGAGRRTELGIRMALGASRGRLVRQLVTESLLLGTLGGALGLLAAMWTFDLLPSFLPAEQARLVATRLDSRVFGVTALLSIAAGMVFGFLPGLHATRLADDDALRGEGMRVSGARGTIVRTGLVVSQVAVTFVLIVSCGLLVRSLSNARDADLGFGTRRAVIATVELPGSGITAQEGAVYFEQVLERVRTLPGIEEVSFAQSLPLAGGPRGSFTVPGYRPARGEQTELNFNVVGHGYFHTMGIPILAGREFDERDTAQGMPVAIVNDTMAQRYFAGRAVGRRLTDRRGTLLEIVGVVKTAKHRSLQEAPLPVVYYPFTQSYSPNMTLVARTTGEAAAYADTVRGTIQRTDRRLAVFRVMTLADHLSEALGAQRLTAALVSTAGAMALALAAIGVYGVVAYGVVRRRKEIGVRVALGARPANIVRLVMSEGGRVMLFGLGVGVAAALAATEVLRSLLFGIGSRDVTTFAGAAIVLTSAALMATLVPALRAARLDPLAVLREE